MLNYVEVMFYNVKFGYDVVYVVEVNFILLYKV